MRRVGVVALAFLTLVPASAETRNPLDALRLETLTATRERPLFQPTRRPVRVDAPQVEVEEKPVAQGPPPYELIGAAVGAASAIALLRNTTTHEILRLHTGDDVEGWRVGRSASARWRSRATGERFRSRSPLRNRGLLAPQSPQSPSLRTQPRRRRRHSRLISNVSKIVCV